VTGGSMSYSFFSIVNTLKDKVAVASTGLVGRGPHADGLFFCMACQSSEAISTLSSDLKDFTAIVQEVRALLSLVNASRWLC
jgi:hypothetical protein